MKKCIPEHVFIDISRFGGPCNRRKRRVLVELPSALIASTMKLSRTILALPLLAFGTADAFSASKLNQQRQQITLKQGANDADEGIMSRRNLLSGAFAASFLALTPNAAMAQDEIPITPFNGLIFNYRNSDSSFGLDASTLSEPSVPFLEFADRLQKGEVKFVEFVAPFGDAAYVTFKEGDGKPIRVGQGYPIEQHDGWSSPAFVVRAVENNNVPYKFTVPGLAKYKQ